jgi:hypothetical protein
VTSDRRSRSGAGSLSERCPQFPSWRDQHAAPFQPARFVVCLRNLKVYQVINFSRCVFKPGQFCAHRLLRTGPGSIADVSRKVMGSRCLIIARASAHELALFRGGYHRSACRVARSESRRIFQMARCATV